MGIATEETKLKKIDGVQVYARKNDADRPAELDAIDLDKDKIDAIAEKLSRRGYGGCASGRSGPARPATSSRRHGPGPATPRSDPFEGL